MKTIKNSRAKLVESEVLEIVELYNDDRMTQKEIAKKFNVERSLISYIINGRLWKDVTGIE